MLIKNPITGRMIQSDGGTAKNLLKMHNEHKIKLDKNLLKILGGKNDSVVIPDDLPPDVFEIIQNKVFKTPLNVKQYAKLSVINMDFYEKYHEFENTIKEELKNQTDLDKKIESFKIKFGSFTISELRKLKKRFNLEELLKTYDEDDVENTLIAAERIIDDEKEFYKLPKTLTINQQKTLADVKRYTTIEFIVELVYLKSSYFKKNTSEDIITGYIDKLEEDVYSWSKSKVKSQIIKELKSWKLTDNSTIKDLINKLSSITIETMMFIAMANT